MLISLSNFFLSLLGLSTTSSPGSLSAQAPSDTPTLIPTSTPSPHPLTPSTPPSLPPPSLLEKYPSTSIPTFPGNLTTCPLFELIFARGTNEPRGLGRIGASLYQDLLESFPPEERANAGSTITAYAVDYKASSYKGRHFSAAVLQEGAEDVKRRIDRWIEEERVPDGCKDTKVVLGGFSLGAAVLQRATLSEGQKEKVLALVTFGYPFLLRPKQNPFPVSSDKVWSKCIPQDPVCNRNSIKVEGTFEAHKRYGEFTREAAEFIWRRVRKELGLPPVVDWLNPKSNQ